MIRFIGDIHGKFHQYKRIIKGSPPSIQVGDMGVGFLKWPHGDPQPNPPYDLMVKGGHRFIRGNHDNPNVCRNHTQWISDGHYDPERKMMFVGGADSIDKQFRIEGFSWWPDEELSEKELNKLICEYITLKPEIMVTHNCPSEIAKLILGNLSVLGPLAFEATRTNQAFQAMWSAHSPKLWVFGHWHISFDHVLNGTRFVCVPECEHVDIDA